MGEQRMAEGERPNYSPAAAPSQFTHIFTARTPK
jgi:hypothetical protein